MQCIMAIEPNRYVLARWALLGSVLSLLCCARSINVALHAQVPPSSSQIVGSAVTMAGVRQALLSRNWSGSTTMEPERKIDTDSAAEGRRWSVENVTIFYPFEYQGLHDRSWDLVIIEGWFGMINSFIHEVRVISQPRPVTVLFYCLDPIYPGLAHVAALDVEGFLANSESTRQYLLHSAPTALVPLAVDTDLFSFYPDPPCPDAAAAAEGRSNDGFNTHDHDASVSKGSAYGFGRVVYVGAAGLLEYKGMLAWMLREAAPYGLDIYGSGWQNLPEFSEYWRGVLPQNDLGLVYGTALAVIGVTMDAQRESGKINNRVFEALSVGASLISDHFPALESMFGDAILYVQRPGDVARHIEALLLSCQSAGRNEAEANARQRRRAMIEDSHSWPQRVEDITSFVGSLPGNGEATVAPAGGDHGGASHSGGTEAARCLRQRGCLTLAVVVDGDLEGDITFESTFVPAVELLGSMYLVTWWVAPVHRYKTRDIDGDTARDDHGTGGQEGERESETKATFYERRRHMQVPRDVSCLSGYDVVWAAGRWGGLADRTVRGLLQRGGATPVPRMTTPRLTEQLTGLVLWGSLCAPNRDGPNNDVGDSERGCPEYAGNAGLRWYDVVYCQTRWDHEFLRREAFEGAVSDNLQQAWGYGPARPLPSNAFRDDAHQETATSHNHPLGVLVVGTDAQISDMLRFLEAPGLTRGALAIIVPPVSMGTPPTTPRSEIASVLAAAGVVAGEEDIGDLPQRLSLYAVDSTEGSSFAPLATEVLLVRSGADAEALAELASGAAQVVVAATGQLGAWATLVTTSNANDGRRWEVRGREGFQDAQRFGDIGDDDGRIRTLVEEQPKGWDAALYSRRLVAGMTRALCLGRGNSRISLARPDKEGAAGVVGAADSVVTVEVLVEDFHVGRDGEWCITVQGRTALCVFQNRFVVDLHISSSASEEEWGSVLSAAELRLGDYGEDGGESSGVIETDATLTRRGVVVVEIVAELRSNMYTNVLQRSEPFKLFIDPSVDAASAYGTGARCIYGESSLVDCNQTSVVGDDDSFGVAFVDAKDYFETGHIVALGFTRAIDRHVPRTWR